MNDAVFDRFLKAMGSEWVVESYSLDDDDKLRVHYRSVSDPALTWSHRPFNELEAIPKVGTIGMIGFIAKVDYIKFAPGAGNSVE